MRGKRPNINRGFALNTHTRAHARPQLVRFAVLVTVSLIAPTLAAPGPAGAACPNEAIREAQKSTYLPDCRAYELVSPPDKNGGNLIAQSTRTVAAADGSAIAFTSLSAFAEPDAAGLTTEYLAERSTAGPGPLGTGWVTHSITPLIDAISYEMAFGLTSKYVGGFTPDLSEGVFFTEEPLIGVAADPDVAGVPNLYMRTDVRSGGKGAYRLITGCPRCREKDEKEGAGKGVLPAPASANEIAVVRPTLAAMSPDGAKVLFESVQRLTADAPLGSLSRLYESENGGVRLVGRIPAGSATECDDAAAPACKGAEASIAGQGAKGPDNGEGLHVHVLSDGSDGHSRVFFTFPTANGSSYDGSLYGGRLYLREDGHYTVELNASERKLAPDSFAPAYFWDASANGERVFFTTSQALTDDAPVSKGIKLYMYDASKPGSDPHNLTYISPDNEPADNNTLEDSVQGVAGVSRDGSYVYFIAQGQLVAGAPPLKEGYGLYLWHEGTVQWVSDISGGVGPIDFTNVAAENGQARVTPDGRYLLYYQGTAHGEAAGSEIGGSKGELYVYDALASTATKPVVACISCSPGGGLPTDTTLDVMTNIKGASRPGEHENHPISDDGRYVFFTAKQALVPQDVNEKDDVYEYDTQTKEVHLLSSGTETTGSWFLDASPDGSNVFIMTAQPLLGWDRDGAYDLYDVRVGGGFPEPVPSAAPCASSEACQGALGPVAPVSFVGTTSEGAGNPKPETKPTPGKKACPKGQRLKRVQGVARCVKPAHRPRRHKSYKRHARSNRGGGR